MKTYFKNFSDFFSHVKMPGFATMMLSVIFLFLIGIGIWGFLRIRNIQKGNLIITEYGLLNNEKEKKPLIKLIKKDYIIMLVMTLLYAIPAIYNLGGFKIPETPWAPADINDGFIVDLGREVEVTKVMLYQGYNEEKYDGTKFNIKFFNSNGTYSASEALEKSGFFSWKVSTKEF